jgi:hypothetical protein
MADSPFQDVEAHPDAQVRADIEQDLRVTRRRLDYLIARFRDAAEQMAGVTGRKAFTPSDIAGLHRIITRLEGCAAELTNAGF